MKILFLDQSSGLGGAELCLADIAYPYRETSLVAVFNEGPFPEYLRHHDIPVETLIQKAIEFQKASGIWQGLKSGSQILSLVSQVRDLSQQYDVIYANTQKALVVAALASVLGGRPFVYHLHDIVSPEHFSATNRVLITRLASMARLIIANSQASKQAFLAAGGRARDIRVIYNGFRPEDYDSSDAERQALRHSLGLSEDQFVVGHFSRISPWKGQHILLDAISRAPEHVVAILVGDALFGEDDYGQRLRQDIERLGLGNRVRFLGFRSDIPQLMNSCDLVAHTSIAPEPFGRVIVEAMMCHRPVVAANAGGATELIQHGRTGWLTPPGDAEKLTQVILNGCNHPELVKQVAEAGYQSAYQRFNLTHINQQLKDAIEQVTGE